MEKTLVEHVYTMRNQLIKPFIDNNARSWAKVQGDITARVIRRYILDEFTRTGKSRFLTASDPNAYIMGFHTEFDLLIVDKDAAPLSCSNVFAPSEVKYGIEIKSRGIFGGKAHLEDTIGRTRDGFDEVRNKHSHIGFVYLALRETTKVVKQSSINYFAETQRILDPYQAFCLVDSRSGLPVHGTWSSFMGSIS